MCGLYDNKRGGDGLSGINTFKSNYSGVQVEQAIDNALNKVPSLQNQINSIETADSNAGIGLYMFDVIGTNALTTTITGLTLFNGLHGVINVANTNTDSVTLNLNDLGDIFVKKIANGIKVNLSGGELIQGSKIIVQYDGTDFVLVRGGGMDGGSA